ncbi:hypothetical protein [Asanoa sp. NPDC050611]|uniref:hypothetical protein n=1 Tax=Asanoa sp. NPDC050611 TaxID=3157098 RepID=UPI0033FDEDCC
MSTDVFVDRTGRRRRVLAWLAVTSAAVLVGALGLLAAGLLTGSPLPLPGWTGGTPEPESAVIGPAPPPAVRPTAKPASDSPAGRSSSSVTTGPAATTSPADKPGRGIGRGNRPTDKPGNPKSKAG